MRFTILLALFALLPIALPADKIYFNDDITLECDVIKVTKNDVTVKIQKGVFTFPRTRIVRIEYNYDKKRDMLAKDDYAGHYNLGLWCLDCDQEDNALVQFQRVEGKPDVPDEIYLKLAGIHLKRDNKEKAVEYYKKYLAKHPEDTLIAKKIEELTKEETPVAAIPGSKTELKKADEGLEIMSGWRVEKWANPGTITTSKTVQNKIENKILKIEYQSKKSDKTAVRLQYNTDLSRKKTCRMDVYNPENRITSLAIAFVTSPGFNWYESKTIALKPGWNMNVSFDLAASEYKTKATNWTFKSDIKNRNKTVQLIMLVYNGPRSGSIFFDSVKFE